MGLVHRLLRNRCRELRDGEAGSAHLDMLFNLMMIMFLFFVIASTIQLALADVSARNSNRMALQTFQVVYDRTAFPQELQDSVNGAAPTVGESPNLQRAVQEASVAARQTGVSVFNSGIVGAQAGLETFDPASGNAVFYANDHAQCPDQGLLNFNVQPRDDRVLTTTVSSSYPWRFGPAFFCLKNTGSISGRSN